MLTERLQILVSRAQRRRLEAEAKRRRTSVGSLVREAIESRYGGFSPEERVRAFERIRRAPPGPFLSVEDMERLVAQEREEWLGRISGRRT